MVTSSGALARARICDKTLKEGKAFFVCLYSHYLFFQRLLSLHLLQCSGKHYSCAMYLFGDKVFALKMDSVLLPKHRCLL